MRLRWVRCQPLVASSQTFQALNLVLNETVLFAAHDNSEDHDVERRDTDSAGRKNKKKSKKNRKKGQKGQ